MALYYEQILIKFMEGQHAKKATELDHWVIKGSHIQLSSSSVGASHGGQSQRSSQSEYLFPYFKAALRLDQCWKVEYVWPHSSITLSDW